MARVFIDDFPHRPGGHCGSTAMRDLLAFGGHALTEDMVFGLGSGIYFMFIEHPDMEPPVHVGGRCPDLERNLCDRLGVGMELVTGSDPEEGWLAARAMLDQGIPVMVHADVFHLDYLRAKRHFSAHRIVLVGYDEDRGIAFVADNDRDGIQECSLESLALARSSAYPPRPADQAYYRLSVPSTLTPLPIALLPAIEQAVRQNAGLDPSHASLHAGGAKVALGIAGLKEFADALPRFPGSMSDDMLSLTCKSIYVSAEKGGTGYGGNFRRMYGRFLIEASSIEGVDGLADVGREFIEIGDLWTRMSLVFKDMSREGAHAVAAAHPIACRICEREAAAFELLGSIARGWSGA